MPRDRSSNGQRLNLESEKHNVFFRKKRHFRKIKSDSCRVPFFSSVFLFDFILLFSSFLIQRCTICYSMLQRAVEDIGNLRPRRCSEPHQSYPPVVALSRITPWKSTEIYINTKLPSCKAHPVFQTKKKRMQIFAASLFELSQVNWSVR